MQVKKHSLAWAEGSWFSAFTFYEPVLQEEIILKGAFFKVFFFSGFGFNIHCQNKTLLIYQREKQKGWHMTFLSSKSRITPAYCGFNANLIQKRKLVQGI